MSGLTGNKLQISPQGKGLGVLQTMSWAVTSPKRKPQLCPGQSHLQKENLQIYHGHSHLQKENTDASFKDKTMLSLTHNLLSKGLT